MNIIIWLLTIFYAGAMVFMLIKIIRRKRSLKMLRILMIELDPERYIERVTAVIDQGKLDWRTIIILENSMATAYSQMGDHEKAIRIHKRMLADPKFRYRGIVMGQLAQIYLAMKDLPNARKHWEEYKATFSRKDEKKLARHVQSTEAHFDLLEGNYKKSLDSHLELLSFVRGRGEEVQLRFRLAEIYEKLGKTKEQKEELEHVVDRGNTLHIVELARQQLLEL